MTKTEFKEIYHRLYRPLYIYARDFIDDREVCRDILSDIFAKFWINRDTTACMNPEAYLRSAVRNACISWLRTQKVGQQYEEYVRLTTEEAETLDSMDERLTQLTEAITTLPEKTRFALEQCHLNRKSYKETAAMMGITPDGVKKHIIKAYSLLRQYFRKSDSEA